MSDYPNWAVYRALYARYFKGRDISELLDLVEPLKGTHVADLCGGEGQVALGALKRGAASATLVERSANMIPPDLGHVPHLRVAKSTVWSMFSGTSILFDRAVCRQAVNYWLTEETAQLLARSIFPGGVFAFNTFNREPPRVPRTLQYEFEGHQFVEISWLVRDVVHHVQVRDGMEPHVTQFKWLPPAKIRAMLEPHFHVEELAHDKASLYKCTRK